MDADASPDGDRDGRSTPARRLCTLQTSLDACLRGLPKDADVGDSVRTTEWISKDNYFGYTHVYCPIK